MALNGQLDRDDLDLALGYYFTKEAAWALNKVSKLFEKKFGYPLSAAQGYRALGKPSDDAFLSPATQWSVWNKYQRYGRPLAARPGTSNHGWATAVDLSGSVASYNTSAHEWFRANGPAYGWYIDTVRTEPWHADFRGLSEAKKKEMADEMPLNDEDLKKIRSIVREEIKTENTKIRKQIGRVRLGIVNLVKRVSKNSRLRDKELANDLDAICAELEKADEE